MKYTCEILIKLPRQTVLELVSNPEYLCKWQPGLKSLTHLDGKAGEEGALSELVFESRKGDLVMTESIIRKQPPEQYHIRYRSHGVYNEVENWFIEKEPDLCLWRTVHYFRFGGFMMFLAPFMKQAFIHNTMLNMDRFKVFAENPEIE